MPVIITESKLVSALLKWTPDYLHSKIARSGSFVVFESLNKNFRYWDNKAKSDDNKAKSSKPGKANEGNYEFTPPTNQLNMAFPDFFELLRYKKDNNGHQYYL